MVITSSEKKEKKAHITLREECKLKEQQLVNQTIKVVFEEKVLFPRMCFTLESKPRTDAT